MLLLAASMLRAQSIGRWEEQPIAVDVRGLMGISMADTGHGYAVGDVDVLNGQTGVLVKRAGNPTWHPVPPSAFTPALNIALSSWAQDVFAIPNTGIAYVSWRDDYRSLVYKTFDYGYNWFSVSPQNPILYGIRYALTFSDPRHGMIVGEGPGRVHETRDGGAAWKSYILPVSAALTDVKFTGSRWLVAGGNNALFRYNPLTQKWVNLSFKASAESYGSHMKISFVDDEHGFLYGYNQGTGYHLLKTTNGGVDWTPSPGQPSFASTPGAHRGIFFFDTLKGWVASRYNEFAYTSDGGSSWSVFQPNIFGNKTYQPVNKMVFLNEAVGWAVGGIQRTSGYPSVSEGWIFKWTGTQTPDISQTNVAVSLDTLACGPFKDFTIPIVNSGAGNLTIPTDGISFSNADFSLRVASWPIVIPPGESREVTVRWEPDVDFYGPVPPGSMMEVTSNDTEHNPWTIALTGLRIINDLRPLSQRIVFAPTCRNDTVLVPFPVTTYGNRAPRILGIEDLGTRASIALLSHGIGDSISRNDSLRFALLSDRSGVITGSVRLMVGHEDCPEMLTLPYEAFIESNEMELSPKEIEFEDVCVGSERIEYVQLENVGNLDGRVVTVIQTEGQSDFAVLADTAQRIAPNTTFKVPVRFAPTTADSLPRGAVFRLVLGPCTDTLELVCSGRGVRALLRTDPDSALAIGPVPLNIEVRRNVLLRNRGFDSVSIADIWFDPPVPGLFVIEPAALPRGLRPTEELDIVVSYTAPLPDTLTTMLQVSWSDPCPDTLRLPVLIRSAELPFAVVEDSLRFDDQICVEPVIDSVEVRNGGQRPLRLSRTDLHGMQAGHFRVLRPRLPVTVPPDSSVFLVLAYDAPSNQHSQAELLISHNDSSAFGETRVRLIGRRNVRTLILAGDTLSPLSVCIGSEGRRRFELRNPHGDALRITDIDLAEGAPFAFLTHASIPADVPPMGSFPLELAVTVPVDTVISVVMRVRMEPCSVEYLVHLDAGVYHPLLTVLPDPLDFGTRALADTSRFFVHVTNADTMTVQVEKVLLRDLSSAVRIQPSLPVALLPDSVLPVNLQLRALKDTGSYFGALCVLLSSPCPDTLCFPLQLRIEDRALVTTVDTVEQLHLFCDSLICDTVTVTNTLTEMQMVDAAVLNPAVFSVTPDTAVPVDPGGRAMFIVCSRRPASAEARGQLLLRGNAGALTAVQFHAVREDGGLLLPDTIDAGNIPACEDERVVVRQIFNSARVDEVILNASIDHPAFTLLTQLPLTVPAGSPAMLRMRYRPGTTGVDGGTLSVRSRLAHCERVTDVVLTGRYAESYIEAIPSTLLFANVVAGTSQTRTLRIRNRDMLGLRIAALRVQDDPPFTATPALPLALDTGDVLDIDVRFLPDTIGSFFGSLCLIIDEPCADTVCIALEGQAIDGDLVFDAAALRFDTLAQCEEQELIAVLRNTGSTEVLLQSASVGGAGAAAYSIRNPIIAPERLPAGESRDFRVRFAPASVPDGPVVASLFVGTDAPKQPVLELPMRGMRVRQVTPPDQIVDLGPVLVGSPFDFSVTITNPGTAQLTLGSLWFPDGYALLQPMLPKTTAAGRSTELQLRYTPAQEGGIADTLVLRVSPCADSMRIIVRGSALRHFVQTDLDLGALPFCETRSGFVSLTANVAPSALVERIAVTGTLADRFQLDRVPTLPFTLLERESIQLQVLFTPAPGDRGLFEAELESDVRIDGQLFTFRSSLRAFVRDGGLSFPPDMFLGAAPLGTESAVVEIVGRNMAEYAVTADALRPQSMRLRVVETVPPLPAVIPPGDSLRVRVTFTPDRQGRITDSLLFDVSSPCTATIPVRMAFSGEGDLFAVSLSVPDIRGEVDDTVSVPLLLSRDISGLGVDSWAGTLGFNPSMLYPVGVDITGSASENMRVRWTYDPERGAVSMHVDSGQLTAAAALLRVRLLVLVGDDTLSALRPADFRFSHPAIWMRSLQGGSFALEGYCLADGRRLIRTAAGMALGANIPNPVRDRTSISFTLTEDRAVRLSVHDARGREIAILVDGTRSAGRYEHEFDAGALSPGTYFFVLRSGDAAQIRRMSVIR